VDTDRSSVIVRDFAIGKSSVGPAFRREVFYSQRKAFRNILEMYSFLHM
jgi:hypothetical protein